MCSSRLVGTTAVTRCAVVKRPASGDKAEMRCIAAAIAGFVVMIAPASAQESTLKAALTACMTRAVTQPLPQMLDVDNPEAVVYACEGQPALALFTAMELVSNQTVEGDVIARRAGSIVCSSHKPQGLNVCTITVEATAPFAKQVR